MEPIVLRLSVDQMGVKLDKLTARQTKDDIQEQIENTLKFLRGCIPASVFYGVIKALETEQTAALRTAAREFLQASELNDMVTMNEWIEKYNALAARLDGQE